MFDWARKLKGYFRKHPVPDQENGHADIGAVHGDIRGGHASVENTADSAGQAEAPASVSTVARPGEAPDIDLLRPVEAKENGHAANGSPLRIDSLQQDAILEVKPSRDTASHEETKEDPKAIRLLVVPPGKAPDYNALVNQYCVMRQGWRPTFPEVPTLPGDDKANFLLAVTGPKEKPVVLAGFRLCESPAALEMAPPSKAQMMREVAEGKRKVDPDKGLELERHERGVEADKLVRLEELFPGIDRSKYAILNVDGAFFSDPGLELQARGELRRKKNKAGKDEKTLLELLLEKMKEIAIARNYDAIYLMPALPKQGVLEGLAERIGKKRAGLDEKIKEYYKNDKDLNRNFVAVVDYGDAEHNGDKKHILAVVLNHQLMKLVPPSTVDEKTEGEDLPERDKDGNIVKVHKPYSISLKTRESPIKSYGSSL